MLFEHSDANDDQEASLLVDIGRARRQRIDAWIASVGGLYTRETAMLLMIDTFTDMADKFGANKPPRAIKTIQ